VQCVICSSHTDTVHLWCSHVICAPCGTSAHSFGHRRCPVCRVPHLLDMAQLRTKAKQLRKGYNDWRRGKPKGAKRQTGDVSGYTGWRFDVAADCDNDSAADEMYSVDAGLLFVFDPRRALTAQQALPELELEKKIAELKSELKQVQLEKKIAELTAELEQVQLANRAQEPKRFRWADVEGEKCLAEPMGSPDTRLWSQVRELRSRPMSRRRVTGTAHPLRKLTPNQIAYRKSLIGQRVRVLEQGPDTGLTGILSYVSPHGYATIILEGAGPNIVLPPRVAADPAVRHVLEPRCVYSCAIGPVPTPVFQRSKLRRGFRRTVGFNHVSFLECQSNSLDLYEFADEDDDC